MLKRNLSRVLHAMLIALAVALGSASARADFLCCNMLAPGSACTFAPAAVGEITQACPVAGVGDWWVTLTTVGRAGGATVGPAQTNGPLHGLCIADPTFYGLGSGALHSPKSCTPIVPSIGLKISHASMPNTYSTIGANLIDAVYNTGFAHCDGGLYCQRYVRNCFIGAQPRAALDGEVQIFNGYMCSGVFSFVLAPLGPNGERPNHYSVSMNNVGDVDIPDVATKPFTNPTMGSLGGLTNTPHFDIKNASPNQPVLFFRSFNGVVVDNFVPVGTTDITGRAGFDLPWPTPGNGNWVTAFSIDGFYTNTITFQVGYDWWSKY